MKTEKEAKAEKEGKKAKKSKKAKSEKKTKKSKKQKVSTHDSKSGKYKSLRHLMETLFAKNKELEMDAAVAAVKKEFPGCSFLSGGRTNKRFGWYKSHIVNHREFTTIDSPKWAKGGAKIK